MAPPTVAPYNLTAEEIASFSARLAALNISRNISTKEKLKQKPTNVSNQKTTRKQIKKTPINQKVAKKQPPGSSTNESTQQITKNQPKQIAVNQSNSKITKNQPKPCSTNMSNRKMTKKQPKQTADQNAMNNHLLRLNKIPVQLVQKKIHLIRNILPNVPITFLQVPPGSNEWNQIRAKLSPSLNLVLIYKVDNPFLKMAFDLKRMFAYNNKKPKELYHGTKFKHVINICTYNFNWRLAGLERGHLYGQGVNFTPKPKFALNFCDREKEVCKIVLLADVLMDSIGVGTPELKVAPEGCDTAKRENGNTFVKFCDAEFCPTYILYLNN